MLNEAMSALVAQLEAAGIRATVDPRDVNPPAVLVEPPTMEYRFATRAVDYAWTLTAIVPNSGTRPALDELAELVEDVRVALMAGVRARPVTWVPLEAGDPLPAYAVEFTQSVKRC